MTESNNHKVENKDKSPLWGVFARILIMLGTTAVLVICFPWERTTQYAHLTVGSVVTDEIIAPFDFEVLKTPSELEQERLQAREFTHPVFARNDSIARRHLEQLEQDWAVIQSTSIAIAQNPSNLPIAGNLLKDSLASRVFFSLDSVAWAFLAKTTIDPVHNRQFFTPIQQIIQDIFASGILSVSPRIIQSPDGNITVMERGEELIVEVGEFLVLGSAKAEVLNQLKTFFTTDESQPFDTLRMAYELIIPFLEPNIIYDGAETEKRRDQAVANVPTVKGLVLKNERIVDSNVRLTQDHLDKLRSLEAKEAELVRVSGGFQFFAPILGRVILVLGLIVLLGGVLHYLGYRIAGELRHMIVLSLILVLPVVAASFIVHQANVSPIYLPITAVVIVSVFLFNITTAVGVSIGASILVSAVAGFGFSTFILCLFPSLVAVISVQAAQTRAQIMKAAIPIGITYLASIVMLNLLQYSFGMETLTEMAVGAANAVVSPILAMGLLIPFELISGITSDLTLLELSDLNRPLLRKLASEAPGTYHHSILVGNLSEAAAEEIGANPLLVRVASYYHDIGKIDIKKYFIENQVGGDNIHDMLAPETSASHLRDHVTRGLAMARKYRIPKVVRDFIPQHHGTNIMPYFYHKALKQTNAENIDKEKYRYPGPKPQSREAAIVMLADVVEASTRALKDPNPDDIKKAINQAVESRVEENQLDDSDLTLKDIRKIREAFARVLSGMVHQRIEYPDSEEVDNTGDTQSASDK
jgi:putative nucleotidyltransferase with HDIG domain